MFGHEGGHMPSTKRKVTAVRWLSPSEYKAVVESKARKVLGISADEFVANWRDGKYHATDPEDCPGIVELSMIAPLPRRKSGAKNSRRGR
jgi:hypothetical protein